ncbi:hypothetical protein G9A89_019591 [Geosiphon pyriformis]|nr:hypothetical protein G9A89_019591 [Geosiphon pyriformis]
MADNNSSLLAATSSNADEIPGVVLNTSQHGEGSSSSGSRTGSFGRRNHSDTPSSQPRDSSFLASSNFFPPTLGGHQMLNSPRSFINPNQNNNSVDHINHHESGSLIVRIYQNPKFTGFMTTFVVHFLFPFIGGVMAGFGEICANELAFRLGWFGSGNIPLHSRPDIPLGLRQQYGAGLFGRRAKRKTGEANDKDPLEKNDKGEKKLLYSDLNTVL